MSKTPSYVVFVSAEMLQTLVQAREDAGLITYYNAELTTQGIEHFVGYGTGQVIVAVSPDHLGEVWEREALQALQVVT